jgi:hypothetical protein
MVQFAVWYSVKCSNCPARCVFSGEVCQQSMGGQCVCAASHPGLHLKPTARVVAPRNGLRRKLPRRGRRVEEATSCVRRPSPQACAFLSDSPRTPLVRFSGGSICKARRNLEDGAGGALSAITCTHTR